MDINDYKSVLEDIVNSTLYVNPVISRDLVGKYEELKKYIINSNNAIDDIRTLLIARNNENYSAYDEYLKELLSLLTLDLKMEILNNQSKYDDIIKNDDVFVSLWDSSTSEFSIASSQSLFLSIVLTPYIISGAMTIVAS